MDSLNDKVFEDLKNHIIQTGNRIVDDNLIQKVLNYKDRDDLVTLGDMFVDDEIVNYLKLHFPNDSILSEESGTLKGIGNRKWILDPIDGTKYFSKSLPLYSISIALEDSNKLELGIVYNPSTGHFYSANANKESTVYYNGLTESINVSPEKKLESLTAVVEIPNHNDSELAIQEAMSHITSLVKKITRVRILGVGSLSLCYCAQGAFDVYINLSRLRKRYDYAAGEKIMLNAGGIFDEDEFIFAGREQNIRKIQGFLGF